MKFPAAILVLTALGLSSRIAGCVAHAAQTNLCWQANGAPNGCTFEVCRNKTNNIIARTIETNVVVNYRNGDSFRVRSVSQWSEPIQLNKPSKDAGSANGGNKGL